MSNAVVLSPSQQQVVTSRGEHVQVIACAGSGKTESVSRRVAALIAEGVSSDEIVAFTFTERAASELKDRIVRRVAEVAGKDAAGRLAQMYVGTIHGYCLRVLQDHVPKYGNFDVVDEHRHAAMLFRFSRDIGVGGMMLGGKTPRVWEGVLAFARTVDVISNECITAAEVDATDFGPLYRQYIDVMDRLHLLTYGRIIQEAVAALSEDTIRRRVVGKLKHLIVDEYQDINPSQDRLIALMASYGAHVCVVGDDDQAIYQWRGSDVTFIQRFSMRFAGARQIVLNENRRSVGAIVTAAAEFASTIDTRLPKQMQPTRPTDQCAIIGFKQPSADSEADAIATTIESLHDQGVAYRDIAVLYRSVSTSTGPLAKVLHERRIPFSCAGRSGLFQQPEVLGLLKAHLWIGGMDWYDKDTRQAISLTPRAIATELVAAFKSAAAVGDIEALLGDWKRLVDLGSRPANLIEDLYLLMQTLGADSWDLEAPDVVARMGALARFSNILADFENTTRRGRYEKDDTGQRVFRGGLDRGTMYYQRLAGYLRYYAQEEYEEFEGEDGTGIDAVQIMTVHGAKGLEWPVVFMPSLQDSRFPSSKAGRAQPSPLPETVLSDGVRQRYAGGEQEERRLFYVAMTRARDVLYLSHFDRTAKKASSRSRFLNDIFPRALPDWTGPVLPGPIARGLGATTEPVALSLTELIRYDDCGYRFRLQRAFGFETQLVSELGFGRAIHHVLRRIAEETKAANRIPDLPQIEGILDNELYFPFANRASEPQMKQKARNLVTHYVNKHRDDLLRIWATERPFELHLPGGFLSGRADVILDREGGAAGSLAILDYKSATDTATDDNFRFQLQVYAAAARSEGLEVSAAYLHDLSNKTDPRSSVPIDANSCNRALTRVQTLFGEVSQRRFPPKPEAKRCGACEYRMLCKHRDGSC
jgi:DNA helicase-2/ATP-dependent DNA helicase PcrA